MGRKMFDDKPGEDCCSSGGPVTSINVRDHGDAHTNRRTIQIRILTKTLGNTELNLRILVLLVLTAISSLAVIMTNVSLSDLLIKNRLFQLHFNCQESFAFCASVDTCRFEIFISTETIDEIIRRTLDGLRNSGVLISHNENLVDLEYANDIFSCLRGEDDKGFPFAEVVESTCQAPPGEYFDGIFGMGKPPPGSGHETFQTTLIEYVAGYGIAQEKLFTFRFCGLGQSGSIPALVFLSGDMAVRHRKGATAQRHVHVTDSTSVMINLSFVPLCLLVFLARFRISWVKLCDLPVSTNTDVAIQNLQCLLASRNIAGNGMAYGEQILCEMCYAVVDTGAPTTVMPLGAAQSLLQNPEIKDRGQGLFYVLPVEVPLVKDFKITIGERVFIIPSKELLISKPEFSIYGVGYVSNYQGLEWTIGLSFLRSFHSVFDEANARMGFATVQC
ncbi:renin [Clonorchis sinensis]|uniref:Renin n=1 Tax=Clonorchis sinensis TaxID=79923 RepID=G7YT32_CLOSI|nr:renin [Clonorchis sinensis]